MNQNKEQLTLLVEKAQILLNSLRSGDTSSLNALMDLVSWPVLDTSEKPLSYNLDYIEIDNGDFSVEEENNKIRERLVDESNHFYKKPVVNIGGKDISLIKHTGATLGPVLLKIKDRFIIFGLNPDRYVSWGFTELDTAFVNSLKIIPEDGVLKMPQKLCEHIKERKGHVQYFSHEESKSRGQALARQEREAVESLSNILMKTDFSTKDLDIIKTCHIMQMQMTMGMEPLGPDQEEWDFLAGQAQLIQARSLVSFIDAGAQVIKLKNGGDIEVVTTENPTMTTAKEFHKKAFGEMLHLKSQLKEYKNKLLHRASWFAWFGEKRAEPEVLGKIAELSERLYKMEGMDLMLYKLPGDESHDNFTLPDELKVNNRHIIINDNDDLYLVFKEKAYQKLPKNSAIEKLLTDVSEMNPGTPKTLDQGQCKLINDQIKEAEKIEQDNLVSSPPSLYHQFLMVIYVWLLGGVAKNETKDYNALIKNFDNMMANIRCSKTVSPIDITSVDEETTSLNRSPLK